MPRHNTRKNTGMKWTVEEDQLLQDEMNQDLSIREIAFHHKRTQGSILHRIYKRKLSKKINVYSFTNQHNIAQVESVPLKTQYCIFDTETTGLPPFCSITKSDQWPRMIQFACRIYENSQLVQEWSTFIKPDGFTIPDDVIRIHHITNELAQTGITLEEWCTQFSLLLPRIHTFVAHNMMFDNNIIQSELYRANQLDLLRMFKKCNKECTMMLSKKYIIDEKMECRLSLVAMCKLFSIPIPSEDRLHDAQVDTELCSLLYHELQKKGVSNRRTDLVTQFDDKDVVKLLGAKWDGGQKTWYIYDSDPFSRYVKKWFK